MGKYGAIYPKTEIFGKKKSIFENSAYVQAKNWKNQEEHAERQFY